MDVRTVSFGGNENDLRPVVKQVKIIDRHAGGVILKFTVAFSGYQTSHVSVQFKNQRAKDVIQLGIPGCGYISKNKQPLIPSFGRYIRVPGPCRVPLPDDITETPIVDVAIMEKGLPADAWVMTSQDNWTVDAGQAHDYDQGYAGFGDDDHFPVHRVMAEGSFEIQGQHVILIHVTPFQYTPQKDKLTFCAELEVEMPLTAAPSDTAAPLPPLDGLFNNLLVNPGYPPVELPGALAHGSGPGDRFTLTPKEPADVKAAELLIIYHETFEQEALTLATWKNQKGLATAVKAAGNMADDPDRLRAYIKTCREIPGARLRYLLLLGDTGYIKPKTFPDPAYDRLSGETILTDYYYSTREDETATGLVFPWVSVGRIPLEADHDGHGAGMAVIRQIIEYEQHPPLDPGYYQKITCAGELEKGVDAVDPQRSVTNYVKTLISIDDHLGQFNVEPEEIFVKEDPRTTCFCNGRPIAQADRANHRTVEFQAEDQARTNVINAFKQGRLIMAHRGHGNINGWEIPRFTNQDIIGMDQEARARGTRTIKEPSVVFSLNCLSGCFDSANPRGAFSEALIRAGRVPALIASTRKAGAWYSDVMMKALFDALWPGILPVYTEHNAAPAPPRTGRYNRIGDILNYAKAYLPVWYWGDGINIQRHFAVYHVLGDPSLEIWKACPKTLRMDVIQKQDGFTVTLSALPEDSVITLSYKDPSAADVFHFHSFAPDRLSHDISLDDLGRQSARIQPGEVTLSFYAPGYRYVQWDGAVP